MSLLLSSSVVDALSLDAHTHTHTHTQKERERERLTLIFTYTYTPSSTSQSQLDHPNVIRLKGVDFECEYIKSSGKVVTVVLIVLELATGGELFELLAAAGGFEETVARTYFRQLIDVVSYCHQHGVAHRDLKPENLLLTNDFQLKLADFGMASAFTFTNKFTFTQCGTRGYMAPEMLQGRGYDVTKNDIWACGVILFIMIAGFPPYQQPHKTDWWFHKLMTKKHALFWKAHCRTADFSESAKDLIISLLCPDPGKRLSADSIKTHPWYQGEVYDEDRLGIELHSRRLKLDEQNERELLEKRRMSASFSSELRGDLEAMSVRGLGDEDSEAFAESDYLPSSAPMASLMMNKGGGVGVGSLGGGTGMASLSDGFGFGFAGLEVEEEGKHDGGESGKGVPTPLEGHIQCHTKFSLRGDPKSLLRSLERSCTAVPGLQHELRPDEYRIKGVLSTEIGPVAFAIQLLQATDGDRALVNKEDKDADDLYTVEVRRRQGNAIHFRSVFCALRAQLGDKIVKGASG